MNGYIIVISIMLCVIAGLLVALSSLIIYAKQLEETAKENATLNPIDYSEWWKNV